MDITERAKESIVENGYDPVYGARPLKRYLQSKIETLIAKTILANDLDAGNTLQVDTKDGEFIINILK